MREKEKRERGVDMVMIVIVFVLCCSIGQCFPKKCIFIRLSFFVNFLECLIWEGI